MMDKYQARYFLLAQACMARVAGMAAMNEYRARRGEAQAYTESDFFEEAGQIEYYATEMLQST